MGGTPFGPIPCPDNKPAKGLTGRSSIYIDRIGLICNFPLIFDSDLKSFRISSTEINAGGSATGTVTLEGLAPSAGVVVNLSSTNSGLATVPPSVTISSRQSSGTFSINAPPGANGGCVDITTSSNGKSQSNPLSVQPAPPANAGFSLSVPPILHFVGDTITGTILLNAPVSGTGTVTLVSSDPSKATVPASISVAVGKATFQINTSAQGCVGISATYNGVTVRRVVKVLRRDG